MNVKNVKLVSAFVGALSGAGCSVAKDEARLASEILNYHSLGEVIERCETAPSSFFYLPPKNPKPVTAEQVRGCKQLAVDKLAAQTAGERMLELAKLDRQRGNYPNQNGCCSIQDEFDTALLDLRKQEDIPSSEWYAIPERVQYTLDRSTIGQNPHEIYIGSKSVEQSIDDNMFLSVEFEQ